MGSSTLTRILISIAALSTVSTLSVVANSKEYIKGDRPQQRGYSEAVITEGGKTVWLAGQIALVDDNGKSLAGDFEGQARQLFKNSRSHATEGRRQTERHGANDGVHHRCSLR